MLRLRLATHASHHHSKYFSHSEPAGCTTNSLVSTRAEEIVWRACDVASDTLPKDWVLRRPSVHGSRCSSLMDAEQERPCIAIDAGARS